MKLWVYTFAGLSLFLIGCTDKFPSDFRFTVEEVNFGERSRYVFKSEIGPEEAGTFDVPDKIKIEVSRARHEDNETMEVVLFDYLDSQLISIGSGTIDIPENGVSLYEWQAQNGNSYRVEVLTGG